MVEVLKINPVMPHQNHHPAISISMRGNEKDIHLNSPTPRLWECWMDHLSPNDLLLHRILRRPVGINNHQLTNNDRNHHTNSPRINRRQSSSSNNNHQCISSSMRR